MDQVLRHGYHHGLFKPDYDTQIAALSEPQVLWVIGGAYRSGLKADYDRHIAGIKNERIRADVLRSAYAHGGLAPDFDKHLASFEDESVKLSVQLSALKAAGLQKSEEVRTALIAINSETNKAHFLADAYDAKLCQCDYDLDIEPFVRSTPRAIALAAAYRHGSIKPSTDALAYFTNEGDLAIVLAGACEAGFVPFDSERIEDPDARAIVLEAACKCNAPVDYDRDIRPLLDHPFKTASLQRYVKVLAAAYKSGGLKASYDHVDIMQGDKASALYYAYKYGGLEPDLGYIEPLKNELMYGSVLEAAYRSGKLAPDFDAHFARTGCFDSEAFVAAMDRGMVPDVKMLNSIYGETWKKLILCEMYRGGKVLPDFERDIASFKNEFQRAWVLLVAYEAGLKPDLDAHVAPIRNEFVKALALAGAIKAGAAIDAGTIDSFFLNETAKGLALSATVPE